MPTLNKPFVHALFILLIVSFVYSNTIDAPFEFDDFDNIVYNPAITDLRLSPDARLDTGGQTVERVKPLLRTRTVGYLTFAMNRRVHGLDVRGYHLVNILIHLASSLLLYSLILLTFKNPFFAAHAGSDRAAPKGAQGFMALFAALFFAAHPVQTQAVTYIVQRFSSLAAMLYLLALVLYVQFRHFVQEPGPAGRGLRATFNAKACLLYAGSLLSALLAMKTKEFAFTLPGMMILYEVMFPTGAGRRRFLFLVPFVLAVLVIPLSLAGTGGALVDTYGAAAQVSGAADNISWDSYLVTQFRVIVTYLRLLVFPVNQNLDYDYPVSTSFFAPEVVFSFLFLLSIAGLGLFLYRRSRRPNRESRHWLRLMSFGIFWFFLTLAPESSIIPIGDVIFEHRLYLPSAGFCIAFTAAMGLIGLRQSETVRKTIVFAIVLLVTVFSVAAYARNGVWRSSVSLCEDMARKSPYKARTLYHLGLAYDGLDRTEEAINLYQRALTAKNVYPLLTDIYNNLGVAYVKKGRLQEAASLYKTALNIKPDDVDLRFNLGGAYAKLGCPDEAIREYQMAARQSPVDPKTHFFLGVVYAQQERFSEAISEFRTVLKLNPEDAVARKNLEILAAKQAAGKTPKGKRIAPSRKEVCSQ